MTLYYLYSGFAGGGGGYACGFTLDENLDFVHVGNLYDRERFSLVYIKFRPILCQVYVGNVRKCHVLVHRTCSKS